MKIDIPHYADDAFEWWYGNRKLVIFLDGSYLKVWGPNIYHDMEEGMLSTIGIEELFEWLYSESK